jgi:hemerythrin-like domain-containing protein
MRRKTDDSPLRERRAFLRTAVSTTAFALAGCATPKVPAASQFEPVAEGNAEAEVTPGEDLMQEHGLLERILLLYDEGARRMEAGQPVDLTVISNAATIVRRFVEDYHERLEEEFVFPQLRAARREGALVDVLLRQHQRGREATDLILQRSAGVPGRDLAQLLRAFTRMYRPHAAREETVLLPVFRQLVGARTYRELGERFEAREYQTFGERGFENSVLEVARLEKAFGMDDLERYTLS